MYPGGGGSIRWIPCLLLICLSLLGGCSAPMSVNRVLPQLAETGDLLQTCARVPDKELQQIRGCYDSYYFGLDVGINLATSIPSVNVKFEANVPPDTINNLNFTGNMANYNNGTVSFQAGVGSTSLGSGIYQIVSVAGNNNIVIANTNVMINIPSVTSIIPQTSIFRTPNSLAGIK